MATIFTMRGVNAKLRRADKHLETIKGKIERFLRAEPYEFVSDYDEPTGQLIAHAQRRIEFPDFDEWSTIIGDAVHNLRSTLDHLAHQILSLQGGIPKTGRGGTAFPIYDTNTGPRGGPRIVSISGDGGTAVTGCVLTLVEMAQPYNRTNDPYGHPLWILSELDNMDKHRELTVAAIALQGFRIGIKRVVGATLHIDRMGTEGFVGSFDERTELARWRLSDIQPNAQVEMNHMGTFDIAFDAAAGPAANKLVVPTLDDLRNYVGNLIEVLRVTAMKQAGYNL